MRGQDDDDLLAQEFDRLKSLDLQRPAHERHVKRARPQPGHGLDRVPAVQDEAEVRQVLVTSGRSGGRIRTSAAGKVADGQIAGAPSGGLLREPPRMLDTTEDVFRLAQEGAAGIRQRHVMTAPIEQVRRQPPPRLADLLTERGL